MMMHFYQLSMFFFNRIIYKGTFYSDSYQFVRILYPYLCFQSKKKDHAADIYLSAEVTSHALENKTFNLKERILQCRNNGLC